MSGNRGFDISQNVAKSFVMMKKDLEEVAKDRNKSLLEIYEMFLSDLQNYFNPEYNRRIEEIELTGFSRQSINKIYEHVSKLKKSLEEKEKKEKQEKQKIHEEKEIEEQINKAILDGNQGTEKEILQKVILDMNIYGFDSKTRKYIDKKLKGRLDEIIRREERVEAAITQIETIFERENQKGKIKNKANYYMAIKNAIIGKNKDIHLSINIEEKDQEQLLELLDQRIKTEKDEIYFEQVRSFTDDFRFLGSYSETANALYGAKRRKFTDIESYHRYSALRMKLQKGNDEYIQIEKLINSRKTDEIDKRILLERKEYMDKEIEKKNKVGEVR